jgi:peptidoglycan/LPS O-acetylase OafA/YrhL
VRAIAVLTVLLYHLDINGFFSAGFLGVDLFFVLSGFLITSQLLREFARDGTITLRTFYLRRARRLFPAVIALLLLVMLAVEAFAPDAIRRTRTDVLPAVFYFSNWWQIFSEQSYFEISGRPPLLQHLWSLAIEEQFYIVWPLALLALLRKGQRHNIQSISLGLMLLSGCWMTYLAVMRGYPDAADPSRVYLGTDTHAFGLFAGAALAALWDPRARRINEPATESATSNTAASPWGQAPATRIDWLGMTALALLLLAMWFAGEASPLLYRGGFILFVLLSALLLFAATQSEGTLPRWLSTPPLAWLGKRSYALYLWHWPIFILLRPDFELPDNPLMQAAVRLVLTGIAAELSYRYVEQPVRSGALLVWAREWRPAYLSYVSAGSALLAATVLVVVLRPMPPTVDDIDADMQSVDTDGRSMDQPIVAKSYRTIKAACGRSVSELSDLRSKPVITVIGDSVLLGASDHLFRRIDGIEIDAAVGRQAKAGLIRLSDLRARRALADTVVIHLGTNGFLGERPVREILTQLRDRKTVILVNVKAPRRWERPNNAIIAQLSSEFPNVKVLDWNAIGRRHSDYFVSDRVHLSGKGILVISSEISRVSGIANVYANAPRPLRVIPCRH